MDFNEYVFKYEVDRQKEQLRKVRCIDDERTDKKYMKSIFHRLFRLKDNCYCVNFYDY